jgi:hypothetical protein
MEYVGNPSIFIRHHASIYTHKEEGRAQPLPYDHILYQAVNLNYNTLRYSTVVVIITSVIVIFSTPYKF